MELKNFLDNQYMQRAAERLLEITIQAALDINNHVLKEQFDLVVSSNATSFQELSRYGVISEELANQLVGFGGFRNRLAHRYFEINYEIVFNALGEALEHCTLYVQQVEIFVDSLQTSDDSEP